jgi:hypothetical protein
MASLMTIYANRSGILDIRTSADRVRYAEALAAAEQAVETGIVWMRDNEAAINDPSTWAGTCTTSVTPPCGDNNTNRYGGTYKYLTQTVTTGGTTSTFYIVALASTGVNTVNYDIIAQGASIDGQSQAVVKQGMYFYSLINPGAGPIPAPFTAAGNIGFGGTFSIVTNANGGGVGPQSGVPVSIWTPKNSDMEGNANAKSCYMGEFIANGSTGCPNDAASQLCSNNVGVKCEDELDNASPFPLDLFGYVFGTPWNQYQSIKSQANIITDCGQLSAASAGIYWIDGDCDLPSTAGSASAPIILVVQPSASEPGDVRMNANSNFYGVLFTFDPKDPAAASDALRPNAGNLQINGGATIWGAIVSNDDQTAGQQINGTYNIVYDPNVMKQFTAPGGPNIYDALAKVVGSWTDFLDI